MNFFKDNWAETLAIIGGLLTALFGLSTMLIEHNSLRPNKKTFGLLLFIAGGLTAFGTFFSTTDNNDKTKKLISANATLISANATIDSLSRLNNILSSSNSSKLDTSLNKLNHIVSESERVLANLKHESKKITKLYKLNEDIQNNLTGGDSYCEVDVLLLQDNGKNVCLLAVENKGNFPLENVTIELIDTKKIKERKRTDRRATLQDISNRDVISIGNIMPHGTAMLNRTITITEGEMIELGIPIQTKNTFMGQSLKIAKIGEQILTASRIGINGSIGQHGKTLSDKADKGFPGEKNGKIKWD